MWRISRTSPSYTTLLGLGIDEFSLNLPAIRELKQKITHLTLAEAQVIAALALKLDCPAKVRTLISAETKI